MAALDGSPLRAGTLVKTLTASPTAVRAPRCHGLGVGYCVHAQVVRSWSSSWNFVARNSASGNWPHYASTVQSRHNRYCYHSEKSIIEFLGTLLPYSQVPSRLRNPLTNQSVKAN